MVLRTLVPEDHACTRCHVMTHSSPLEVNGRVQLSIRTPQTTEPSLAHDSTTQAPSAALVLQIILLHPHTPLSFPQTQCPKTSSAKTTSPSGPVPRPRNSKSTSPRPAASRHAILSRVANTHDDTLLFFSLIMGEWEQMVDEKAK